MGGLGLGHGLKSVHATLLHFQNIGSTPACLRITPGPVHDLLSNTADSSDAV